MKFDFAKMNYIIFDFDGVFTDNRVSTFTDGSESVTTSKYDSLAISVLNELKHKYRFNTFVLSGEVNSVVEKRCRKMGIEHYSNVGDKLKFVIDNFGENSLPNIVFVCNDLNDLQLLLKVGFSFVPYDAPAIMQKYASMVCARKGGDNFVREVVEIFLGDRIQSSKFLFGVVDDL